mmetsp:Transcript_77911/g.137361  ORF Transcript_77911/g.137361 Transcript_77911/m.137361 type:complete len:511 (-) Transcript_77911:727-2259(-)
MPIVQDSIQAVKNLAISKKELGAEAKYAPSPRDENRLSPAAPRRMSPEEPDRSLKQQLASFRLGAPSRYSDTLSYCTTNSEDSETMEKPRTNVAKVLARVRLDSDFGDDVDDDGYSNSPAATAACLSENASALESLPAPTLGATLTGGHASKLKGLKKFGAVAQQARLLCRIQAARRRSVRLASLVPDCRENDLVSQEDQILETVESPDLNKPITGIMVAMPIPSQWTSLGTRMWETALAFRMGEKRSMHVVCVDIEEDRKLRFGSPSETCLEVTAKCGTASLKHDLVVDATASAPSVKTKDDLPTVLKAEAEKVGANLLVVGTKNCRVSVAYTCDQVVQVSFSPVLIVRGFGKSFNPESRLLCLVDESVEYLAGFRYAMRLATSRMKILPVVFASKGSKEMKMVQEVMASTTKSCTVEAPKAINRDLSVSMADQVCQVVNDLDADIVVLGSKHPGVLGSLETQLMYLAPCHVLVYKNPWQLAASSRASSTLRRRSTVHRTSASRSPSPV